MVPKGRHQKNIVPSIFYSKILTSKYMDYKKILQESIDLHVHIGPEIIPRKFDLPGLIKYEKGKLKGIGVKSHFFPTAAMASATNKENSPLIINSVTLNNYCGGFNPDIVRASAELSENPIIVWFPTVHAKKFLENQEFEIPKEWIDPKKRETIRLRPAKNIRPFSVFDGSSKISLEVKDVLRTIKDCGAILATGHISWEESRKLVKTAVEEFKISRIIITHPIYRMISMPIEIQKEMVNLGATIEHCYSMHTIDKIPMAEITAQIKEVGPKNCILSSDVGQTFSKSPSESLADFIMLLENENVDENEIRNMLITNPNKLVKK